MSLSVKETQDNLSEVVRLAESGKPQSINRDGREVAVIVSINEWMKLQRKRRSLVEVLRNSPLVGVDMDLSRSKDLPRGNDFIA